MTRGSWISALVVAVAATPAFAVDRRVPQDYSTIQEAVTAALEGDVVIVKRGRYAGGIIVFGKTGIELRGNGSTIDGAGTDTPIRIEQSRQIKVTGFKIVRSPEDGVLALDSDAVEVSDCRITRPVRNGITYFGIAGGSVRGNRIASPGLDGLLIGEPERPTNDALVESNTISNATGRGVNAFGARNTYRANKIRSPDSSGIFLTDEAELGGDVNSLYVIEDNVVSSCRAHSVFVGGKDGVLRRNAVTKGPDDAFRILGRGHTIEDNRSTKPGGDCFFIAADDCAVRRNTAKGPKDDGFEVDGQNGTYDGNVATKPREDGFDVEGSGNTFTKNRCTTAKEDDLHDAAGAGANTYSADNTFRTKVIQ